MKHDKKLQIENMKKQTFGVEVEMANISREKASKLAANYFGTNASRYTGNEDRYDTYSAFDQLGRKWKFSRDGSIVARCDDEKCEMVTPVLRYEDMDLLQGLIRELRKAGAVACPKVGCGVHIHVDGLSHTPKSILNLVNMMARYESELKKMINIDPSRMHYCETVDRNFLKTVNAVKPATKKEFEDVWYVSQGCNYHRTEHYNSSRYHMLNLHAWFNRYETIEFRMFQFDNPTEKRKGGLHAGQLKAMIQLCLAMSELAKEKSFVRVTPRCEIDEMKSMTKFLSELGLTGKEFKTAREYFTRNATNSIVTVARVFRDGERNAVRTRWESSSYGNR